MSDLTTIFALKLLSEKGNYLMETLSDDEKFYIACNTQWKILWEQEVFTDLEIALICQIGEEAQEIVYEHVCELIENGFKTIPYPVYNRINTNNFEAILKKASEIENINKFTK